MSRCTLLSRGLALAFGVLAAAWPAAASPDPSPLDQALERATALSLSADARWRALLHYEKSLITRRESSHIETDAFFLAPDGRRDAEAELVATLRAFADPDAVAIDDQHPRCAYPARHDFLARALDLEPDEWPDPPCEAFEAWRAGLQAKQLSMIFPEGFMDSPASMFGHTLLRLDVSDEGGKEDLLGYAIDFQGDTGDDSTLVYVAKGIFGFYPGRFGINPYYTQLERYSDWENRDIWEYRLNFTPEQLDIVLMHLWELRGVGFPYYFFDENCSYQLLELMEVARPEIDLTDGFRIAVIPVDTVRALTNVPGLVQDVRFRPSPATELRYALREASPEVRSLATRVANGDVDPSGSELAALPVEDRAAVLSLAYDRLRYSFLTGRVSDEASRGRSRSILVARSRARLPEGKTVPKVEVPVPEVRPEEGHGSAAIALSGGVEDGDGYLELRFRPSFHDLIDPEGGYTKAMEIAFLDTRVRYYPGLSRVRLQELTFVRALSYAPRNDVFKPLAWRLDTGIMTRRVGAGLTEKTVWRTDVGAGLATELFDRVLVYGLGELLLDISPNFGDVASFGPGARIGLMTRFRSDRYRAHLLARATRFAAGETDTWYQAGLTQRVRIRRQLSVELETTWNRTANQDWLHAVGSIKLFF